jgi:hypothetical protein
MLFRGVRPSPLRLFQSREPVHADELMGEIVAKRRLEHLERVGFVAMTRAVAAMGRARWTATVRSSSSIIRVFV